MTTTSKGKREAGMLATFLGWGTEWRMVVTFHEMGYRKRIFWGGAMVIIKCWLYTDTVLSTCSWMHLILKDSESLIALDLFYDKPWKRFHSAKKDLNPHVSDTFPRAYALTISVYCICLRLVMSVFWSLYVITEIQELYIWMWSSGEKYEFMLQMRKSPVY